MQEAISSSCAPFTAALGRCFTRHTLATALLSVDHFHMNVLIVCLSFFQTDLIAKIMQEDYGWGIYTEVSTLTYAYLQVCPGLQKSFIISAFFPIFVDLNMADQKQHEVNENMYNYFKPPHRVCMSLFGLQFYLSNCQLKLTPLSQSC